MTNNLSKKARHQLGLMALSCLVLSGCSQMPVQPYPSTVILAPSPAQDTSPSVTAPAVEEMFVPGDYARLEEITAEGRPAAVHQLLSSGRAAWQGGYTHAALQKFNRAIRIAPNDGLIYFYLASISLEELDVQKAASLARRGLSLSRNPVLRQQLEMLLSTALSSQAM